MTRQSERGEVQSAQVADVTADESRSLFDAFYALFSSSISYAVAFDTIPDALRRRNSSGEMNPSAAMNATAALRALMRLGASANKTVKVSELAQAIGISFSWASRVVDELELMNLVERGRDPADRRVVRVGLTEAGVTLWQQLYDNRQPAFARALMALSPAERIVAIGFMKRLAFEFDRAAKKP